MGRLELFEEARGTSARTPTGFFTVTPIQCSERFACHRSLSVKRKKYQRVAAERSYCCLTVSNGLRQVKEVAKDHKAQQQLLKAHPTATRTVRKVQPGHLPSAQVR